MNIVLIGYRGTGKSAVAGILATALKMPVVSLDEEIIKKAGMRIPEIVEAHGWDHFRDLEAAVTAAVAARDGLIIDTGGGVILRQENVDNLRNNGTLIWLTAPPAILCRRMQGDTERPALKEGKTFLEEVEEVLRERLPLYESAAHVTIDTSDLNLEEVADRILQELGTS